MINNVGGIKKPEILYIEEGKTKSIKEAKDNDIKSFIKRKRIKLKVGEFMPTSSFNKTYVVSDKKVVKQLRKELSRERDTFNKPSKKYYEQRERGKKSLARIRGEIL